MSRRDALLKATSGALNARGLDLARYRQRSSRERPMGMSPDDAAGAMAFAALDRESMPGDPLAALLLRLKYAHQRSRSLFTQAHSLLLHRYVEAHAPSDILNAVSLVALFEWLHDACPKCRGGRSPGTVPQPARGVRCLACRATGRSAFKAKRRWRFVSEYLVDCRAARGEEPAGIALDAFMAHWHAHYWRFLKALRRADYRIAAGLDFGDEDSDNRAIESGREEKQEAKAPVERAGGPTAHEPESEAGEVPPKES